MNRYMVAGVLGLYIVHPSVHNASLNEELTIINFEIFPFQCRDLANAKSQALRDQHHRAIRLLEAGYDGVKAFDSQDHGALPPLGGVFYPHHFDWIAALVDEFPACGTLEKQVHHASYMSLRLRGHIEFLQPTFHRHRSNLCEHIFTPPWLDVQLDVRQVRLPRRVAFWQLFRDVPIAQPAERNGPKMILWLFSVEFQEMSSGLGESEKNLYSISYSNFYTAYASNAASNNDPAASTALAAGVVPNQTDNPVTGSANLAITTADINALGISCPGCTGPSGFDGIVSLNTHITTPGSPGSSLAYYLLPVVYHEIDEVLGLGSSLDQRFQTTNPSVEDLFRYASNGSRSYTTNTSAQAYFSVNGSTDLAQFDNQHDGGDWGDWQSNPLPTGVLPQVQDAFATAGANPALGVEITALEAIGYDLSEPEPGTLILLGTGLALLGIVARRRRIIPTA